MSNRKAKIIWQRTADGISARYRQAIESEYPGKTDDEIGAELGLTRNTVGNHKLGKTMPKVKQLHALGVAGADLNWIVTGVPLDAKQPVKLPSGLFDPPQACPNGRLCDMIATLLGLVAERTGTLTTSELTRLQAVLRAEAAHLKRNAPGTQGTPA
jgi:predicted transcriptional regulator